MYICEKKEKASQYKGVYWHTQNAKWCARLNLKGQQPKYGGTFYDELDAAKSVNHLCEAMDIPLQNPGISGIPNQQCQVAYCRIYFCLKIVRKITHVKTYFVNFFQKQVTPFFFDLNIFLWVSPRPPKKPWILCTLNFKFFCG